MPLATQIEQPELHREGEVQPPSAIPALARLLDDLAGTPIRFCSWKSNEHLLRALQGRTDLDLLVHEPDATALRIVVAEHDLKRLTPAATRDHPGMEHYLGMDPDTGRLFHLHVHTRLVLGEQHVKNHHLPMEEALLGSLALQDGVPVPAAALEVSILVVRALLKYRARDVVKDIAKIRSPGLKHEVRAELDWLLERTDAAEVRTALREAGDPIPAEIVGAFLEAYERDPRSGWVFVRLRSRLRRSLAECRRVGRSRARLRALATGLRERRRPARMSPSGGGLTVAFVGSDGSGKSTVASEIARWWGWKVATQVVYLGSKSPSVRARWSYVVFRAFRRGQRGAARRFGERSLPSRGVGYIRDVLLALHELAVGSDRSRRCRRGRADAAHGQVVIFDRYPMQGLSSSPEHRVLDGPRITRVLPEGGRLVRWLARVEERRYAGLGLPDVVVFLGVDPAIAAIRKPDHQTESLEAKTRATEELATLGERAGLPSMMLRVDASQPLEEVLLRVKRGLWDVV
ncbi:MAG: hypothetical protein WD096_11400 [Actinomycetota bacterium]